MENARALLFDVFGTCVDWRTTVTNALIQQCKVALMRRSMIITNDVRARASAMSDNDWGAFAQEWRNTYYKFTRALAADASLGWKTVDDHHLESLHELLVQHGLEREDGELGGLWNRDEVKEMSLIWHKLDPWPDTVAGLDALNTKYETCTLSNGNIALLKNMQQHGGMPFKHIYSSELFNSYKPNPAIYLGAAKRLGLEPSQCVMVAAHLGDLEAAKGCGYRTIYVERNQEEEKRNEAEAKEKGFVDIWVGINEKGFVSAAERLGLSV
ncbi:haloacid dehalogenase [Aureobasidium subglaciale]|nr:haloacid dehalogenase [Aureobasidium subglaciale]